MAHIDYFLFPLSPFTYLAGQGLEEVAAKHGTAPPSPISPSR